MKAYRKPKECRIGILYGDKSNLFWQEMKRWYDDLAQDFNASLWHFFAEKEGDEENQAWVLGEMVSHGFDAIIVNPMSKNNLVEGILECARKRIFVIDVGAKTERRLLTEAGPYYVPVVTVSFYEQGMVAANYILERLKELRRINVVILEGRKGSIQSLERSRGALDTFNKCSRVGVVLRREAKFIRDVAERVTAEIFDSGFEANAFFCVNDEMALGACKEIARRGLKEKVVIVGVDLTEDASKAIQAGIMDASVAFSKRTVAELVLHSTVAAMQGNVVSSSRRVESVLVTKKDVENLGEGWHEDSRSPGKR